MNDLTTPASQLPAQIPASAPTLYQACEELQAWCDTLEFLEASIAEAEDEETRLQLRTDISDVEHEVKNWLCSAAAKVDRFNAFLSHLEHQVELCRQEENRIAQFRRTLSARVEQLKEYAIAALQIANLKKITGHSSSLSLRKSPPSVEDVDLSLVPQEYFRRTFIVSGEDWMNWQHGLEARMEPQLAKEIHALFARCFLCKSSELERAVVKTALKDRVDVPGVRLVTDNVYLKRD